MAEFAEQTLQEMVPEFEELEYLGLLTSKEIKKLIVKRRNFEYKICKPQKNMQDFFAYALYDIHLLQLLCIRRQKILLMKKYHKIEISIANRALKRLRMMTNIWKGNSVVWKFRLAFAKLRKRVEEVSTIYAEQVKFHGADESLWVSWAQWETEGRENFDEARKILLSRAPELHPESLLLRKEYFRMELLYIQHLKEKNVESGGGLDEIIAENREKVLNCAVPEAIFECALKEFDSPEMCDEFFWIAHQFPFAHHLRDTIYSKMATQFPTDIRLCKLKAKLLMSDHSVSEICKEEEAENDEKEIISDEENSVIISKSLLSPKQKINNLFNLYDGALSNMGSSSTLEFVFEDLFSVLNQVWGSDEYRTLVIERLLDIFASHSSSLTAEQLLLWFRVASAENCNSAELKNILESARKKYPECQDILLASLHFDSPTSLAEKLNLVNSASGSVGAAICLQLIQSTKKKLHSLSLIERVCMHPNDELCAAIRVKLLHSFSEMDLCRKHYEKYCSIPPFSSRFHSSMMKKELEAASLSEEKIRTLFERAIDQFGSKQYGLWLCYIAFQEKFANSKNVSSLLTKAEKQLDPKCHKKFIDCRIHLQNVLKKGAKDNKLGTVNFSDLTALHADRSAFEFWSGSSLPRMFEKDLDISHKDEQDRMNFFASLHAMEEKVKEGIKEDGNAAWEEIFYLICGQNCCFNPKKDDIYIIGLNNEIAQFINSAADKSGGICTTLSISATTASTSARTPSTTTTTGKQTITVLNDETKKLLESSEILQPEFMQQTQIAPYYVGKQTLKKERRKERAKSSGDGWFNMKAPEITEDVERDLHILKMRSVLDPQNHYKRNDMKELPKFFQMGKVVDSPADFYSSRVPKKERKRTFAEEIMKDESVLRYQKRKCTEILNTKNLKRMKRNQAKIDGKKQPKKKDKTAKKQSLLLFNTFKTK